MTFGEAYRKMREGRWIAHEDFKGGYWAWENGTIMIHCRDGTVLDIRQTDDVGYTFGFIAEDKWHVKAKAYRCIKAFGIYGELTTEEIQAGSEWKVRILPYNLGMRLVNDAGYILCADPQILEEYFEEIDEDAET